jgi:hypothetical protein
MERLVVTLSATAAVTAESANAPAVSVTVKALGTVVGAV